ncbi:sulfotransferase family protein [Nonomuraea turcica]|uniref:sulfotransferase family protein n=1 Tax=Nonomuraea sp. G32 TaxID=3067274 RepID=UPI00273C97BB|nr:sulfotransferase family protein [Nonomuraea sp. G32]MDP4511526.1 sulfotransferase [Nonomuraea sp. G32]
MLKVIGAGFPRTGTSSMKAALERLGFGPCYHMFEILMNPSHVDKWLPVTTGVPIDWDQVLRGYQSTQDWPASHFWREQAEVYPDAKIILTVRDPHRWYASMQALIANGPGRKLPPSLPDRAAAVFGALARFGPVMDHIGQSVFGEGWRFSDGMPDEDLAVDAFHRHIAMVQESLPADRLLVFDVRDGWEPLCRFLDVEAPADEPFPHLNDAAGMQRQLDELISGGMIASPFAPER